uniref:ATP synthase subunit a n=1 Tax=Pujadella villari TaxID=2943468 RepID=A0A9E8K0E2_9HYME|nr:ATP synthase F0 subunit 6 [Pujadella villari]
MMMNLFSIFDPSTAYYWSLNWGSVLYFLIFLPNIYWVVPSNSLILMKVIVEFMVKELGVALSKNFNKINLLMFISLFVYILLNNFISLFPYIYNSSSHMVYSLSFSLLMWLSFMMFGWSSNIYHMFVHLTPQGTPYILMPFMVMIETVSNLIRPLTLSIRLTANIIAGHLLMTLMSQSMMNFNFVLIGALVVIQSSLVVLEIAVSFIQSYVFSILSSLYSADTN